MYHPNINPGLRDVMDSAGIVFDGAMDLLPRMPELDREGRLIPGRYSDRLDARKAQPIFDEFIGGMDAVTPNNYVQPTLVTNPNAGILAMLTTYIDPKLIEVLLSPLRAERLYGVTKKGSWVDQTITFGVIENTGYVAAYGDYVESGRSDFNMQWPQRQNFIVQTITEWGDMEVERYGLARVDAAARKNLSSANTLNRYMNLMYFFGVVGLQNYGGLNDPSLAPALTPATKLAGGTGWQNALPTEILADIQAMVTQLLGGTYGSNGNFELEAKMTMGLHQVSMNYLANTNSFGLTAKDMVKNVYPGLEFVPAPEFLSGTTYSCQLIVDEIEGQRAAECAFSEKMRAHRMIAAMSSFRQKKSAGGWGTIIYRPIQIAMMSGI
jgi:hypothetical protein